MHCKSVCLSSNNHILLSNEINSEYIWNTKNGKYAYYKTRIFILAGLKVYFIALHILRYLSHIYFWKLIFYLTFFFPIATNMSLNKVSNSRGCLSFPATCMSNLKLKRCCMKVLPCWRINKKYLYIKMYHINFEYMGVYVWVYAGSLNIYVHVYSNIKSTSPDYFLMSMLNEQNHFEVNTCEPLCFLWMYKTSVDNSSPHAILLLVFATADENTLNRNESIILVWKY